MGGQLRESQRELDGIICRTIQYPGRFNPTGRPGMTLGQFSKSPAIYRTLFVLLFAYSIPIVFIFLPYTFSLASAWGMRVSAIGLAALALLTLWAVWRQEVWAAWSAIAVVSGKLTVDLYAYATHFDT